MNHVKGTWRSRSTILKIAAVASAAGLLATPVFAVHSWGGYHWKRTTTQISPPVGDNVTTAWDSHLVTAVNDWNLSSRIQSPLTAGQTTRSTCSPRAGRIEVCNYTYGSTGWLGIAQIWLSGGHISQATTKLNDTYFNTAQYNTPSWRAAVTCQEIGHDYGLGHQDENFNTDNTNSCMDYTSNPVGNEHPDQHDYDQLASIYSHVHAAAALPSATTSAGASNSRAEWGRAIKADAHGRSNVFERDLGNGNKVVTHVLWLPGYQPDDHQ